MKVDELIILIIFFSFFSFSLLCFIAHVMFYKYLLKWSKLLINRITLVSSSKVNFILKQAHIYAKNNKFYSDLIASWTISLKEMRIITTMASLHVKHFIDLIKNGELIKAYKYLLVLRRSTKIMKNQWNLLVNDIKEFIDFASQPSSKLLDLKQIYTEILTLCREVIKRDNSKTSLLLDKSSKYVERLFEKFDDVSLKGNYNHAYEVLKIIQKELQKYATLLHGVPYVAFLISYVFRNERKKFINVYKLAKEKGIVMEKLQPIYRFKQIKNKILLYNSTFLAKEASVNDISDLIVNEIIALSKLRVFLKTEILSNDKYFKWKVKIMNSMKNVLEIWHHIIDLEHFKFFDVYDLNNLNSHVEKLERLIIKHKKLKNENPYPYYFELVLVLIEIVEGVNKFKDTLNEYARKAINFEKDREILKTNMINTYARIKTLWKNKPHITYEYIYDYFLEFLEIIKKKHSVLFSKISIANYNDFDIIKIEVKKFLTDISKYEWEINTLVQNEDNIRILYEIANRFRSKSANINKTLNTIEKLISLHNIKDAYRLIEKILKNHSKRDLQKYPIVLKVKGIVKT